MAKWLLLAAWLVGVVVAVPFAGKLSKALDNQDSAYLPAHAQSSRVLDLQARNGGPASQPVLVVGRRASGLTGTDIARAGAARAAVSALRLPGAGKVGPLVLSPNHTGFVFSMTLTGSGTPKEQSQQVSAITRAAGPSATAWPWV